MRWRDDGLGRAVDGELPKTFDELVDCTNTVYIAWVCDRSKYSIMH